MSRRVHRILLLPVLLLASESWALGLGDIRLSSALNEPLRAEIELLSATPEELENLDIQLASTDTFERYGIDRPLFLSQITFEVVKSGSSDGNIVRVTSQQPVAEPFVTFLVEATWTRGRLLREYTLLLDPPTFAPPPTQQSTQTLSAPSRATPSDSGTIQRPPQPAPEPQPSPAPSPRQEPPRPQEPPQRGGFDTTEGGDYLVRRGDTLWAIAERVRPDNRLNMNQTMIGIFEANQHAFANNINVLNAGATLRIPSADEIFRISRGEALDQVRQQTQAWREGISAPQPSLTLVPPDGEQPTFDGTDTRAAAGDADSAGQDRIRELERIIDDQDSLLEIRDNELAALREELARLRAERLPPGVSAPVDEPPVDDQTLVDDVVDDAVTDESVPAVDTTPDDDVVEPVPDERPAPQVVSSRPQETGLVDTIIGALTSIWGAIGAALIVVLGILVWFARRAGREEEESTGVWDALDADDADQDSLASTERLRALAREDDGAIVVVEQETAAQAEEAGMADTLEAPASIEPTTVLEPDDDTGTSRTMEDTFSSETAINLDQSDPIAEADFHMAYGLYDQAADLINGALEVEPNRADLLAKLCEIYFVWGNRDGFVDAAQRMHGQVTDETSAAWDKIVIMGQQIAADDEMFSGVSPAAATRAVDLSFGDDDEMGETSALDIDFAGGPDGSVSDVVDIGEASGEQEELEAPDLEASSIDFDFGGDETTSASMTAEMANPSGAAEDTAESPTLVAADATDETAEAPIIASDDTSEAPILTSEDTVERPALAPDETEEAPALSSDATVETPTIEQQFASLDATSELPSLGGVGDDAETQIASLDDDDADDDRSIDATAEINLDDLGLDLDAIDAIGDDEITGQNESIDVDDSLIVTGTNEALEDDEQDATGRNPNIVDLSDSTGGADVSGHFTTFTEEEMDAELDTSLLDATGQTQILSEDQIVETGTNLGDDEETLLASLDDEDTMESPAADADTLLAPLDDDEDDGFDFAKTEALPKDVFGDGGSDDETSEVPGVTDMDLDLDDLTAALKVSALGDTVDQPRDDPTVAQPKVTSDDAVDLDVGAAGLEDDGPTQALSPDEVSADLHDARTMTEVGTKLDLARAYVDMGDPGGARSILEEVLDEGDESQRQQAQQLLDTLPT